MEFSEDYNDAQELEHALSKFEDMLRSREEVFFDVEEIELVVDHFIENQNNNRAKKAIAVGCSQHPYSIDLKIKEAEVLVASGKTTKALDSLLKLATIEKSNADILVLIAGLYSRQKNHVKSIQYLQKATEIANQPELDDIKFDLALEYEHTGSYEKALDIFKQLLIANPENDAVGYELLYCYGELDMDVEAVSFFKEFADNNPYSFLAWYNLGICFSKLELYEKAAQAFDFCTLIEPQVSLPYFQKAFMYLELNDYQSAMNTYIDCLETDNNSAVIHTYIGECHEKLEAYDDAVTAYAKAIQLDDQLSDAWLGLGVVYDLLGKTKLALNNLKVASELNPHGDYVLVYCEALTKAEMYDEAEKLYKSIEKDEEKNASFWLDYSHLISKKYGIIDALSMVDQAYGKIKCPSLNYRKAALLFKFGMHAEATNLLEACIEEDATLIDEFLEYYPEGEQLALLFDLIDLHKNKE